jgi:hypothetical protein
LAHDKATKRVYTLRITPCKKKGHRMAFGGDGTSLRSFMADVQQALKIGCRIRFTMSWESM